MNHERVNLCILRKNIQTKQQNHLYFRYLKNTFENRYTVSGLFNKTYHNHDRFLTC